MDTNGGPQPRDAQFARVFRAAVAYCGLTSVQVAIPSSGVCTRSCMTSFLQSNRGQLAPDRPSTPTMEHELSCYSQPQNLETNHPRRCFPLVPGGSHLFPAPSPSIRSQNRGCRGSSPARPTSEGNRHRHRRAGSIGPSRAQPTRPLESVDDPGPLHETHRGSGPNEPNRRHKR